MKIKPFKGILFNANLVNLADVVTPPYDKISKDKREIYAERNPHNMVHLILPESHDKVPGLLKDWVKNDVLKQDAVPAIYIYEQEYEYPKGKGITKVRRGFVALLELKPFGKNTVMPHEQTFSKIKEERMQLLQCSRMNLGQIFILYSDPEKTVDKLFTGDKEKDLAINLKDEFGISHRLWRVTDCNLLKEVQECMERQSLFIADGHHRYSSALLFKEQEQNKLDEKYTGKEGFNYRLTTFVNINSSDLTILPTHRVLQKVNNLNPEWFLGELRKYFHVETVNAPTYELETSWLESVFNSRTPHTLGIYFGGDNCYTLKLKNNVSLEEVLDVSRPREWLYLDVNILHLLILKNVLNIDTHNAEEEGNLFYVRDAYEAIDLVKNKGSKIACILNPTKIEEVKKIVELGDVMPHKSTDFYPKLHSGLVMRSLEE